MKRIIDGLTYNTDTSTAVARYEYEDDRDREVLATIYVTQGGAYFIVHRTDAGDEYKYAFEPLSRDELDKMTTQKGGNLEIIDEALLNAPPEAAAEAGGEPGATMYVRVPAPLKRRVDEAAKESNLSGNVWAMRCMERCLEDNWKGRQALGNALWAVMRIARDDGPGGKQHASELAEEAISQLESAWEDLGLKDNDGHHDTGTQMTDSMDQLFVQGLRDSYPEWPAEN